GPTCIPAWPALSWRGGVGCSHAHCAYRVRLTARRWLRTFPGLTPGHNMADGASARRQGGYLPLSGLARKRGLTARGRNGRGTRSTLDMTETCTESRSRSL